jgi:hypothetical protein
MMLERWMGRYLAICLSFWLSQLSAAARADDDSLRVALFKTSSKVSELTPLAAALDPVLQAEVERLTVVSVGTVPPLDLPSLQLALDCVGETPTCLHVVVERMRVAGVLSPSLARSGPNMVLSLLLYDPKRGADLQRVTRSFPNEASDDVVFDGAKRLVRQLFGVVEPAPVAEPEPEAPAPTPPPPVTTEVAPAPQPMAAVPAPRSTRSQSLLVPVVLGAVGVGALGVGLGFGLASNKTEVRYGTVAVMDDRDAETADDLVSRAQTQSTIANIAFGVGAASCIAAGVVYFLQRGGRNEKARLALAPGYVSVAGRF